MSLAAVRTDEAYSDAQYALFHRLGWLQGLFMAVDMGSKASFDVRHSRFEEPHLNDRSKGVDRWTYVDQHLLYFADRFGFEPIWVETGRGGHPRMLMIRKDNLIFSAHQVPLPLKAPRKAKYRDALMPLAPNKLTYTQDEIVHMIEHEGVEYWTLTYQQTPERVPHWIILGRPALGEKDLFYSRNVMQTLGIVHPAEEFPEFNPKPERTAPSFTLPEERKREGEGEQ